MRRLCVTLLLALLACTPARPDGGLDNPDTLTEEQIRADGARNAYELVERLRPRWLRERPDRSLRLETTILVYFDGSNLGGIDTLHQLPTESIRYMRVLDSAEAGTLPGLGSRHVERVIMISSNRPR